MTKASVAMWGPAPGAVPSAPQQQPRRPGHHPAVERNHSGDGGGGIAPPGMERNPSSAAEVKAAPAEVEVVVAPTAVGMDSKVQEEVDVVLVGAVLEAGFGVRQQLLKMRPARRRSLEDAIRCHRMSQKASRPLRCLPAA